MPLSLVVLGVFFLFTSFAFGCMENWSIAVAEIILFLGAGLAGYLKKDFWRFPLRLKAFAWFVLVLIAVSLVQMIPLPVSVWRTLDGDRISAYEEGLRSEELLQSEKYRVNPLDKTTAPEEYTRLTPALPGWLTISRSPGSTARAVIALLACLCLIFLLEDVARESEDNLRRLALLTGLCGLAVGLLALFTRGAEKKTHILWVRESERASIAFGPFVNGNHGEAFVNLTFPILCYLIWRKSKDARKRSDVWGMRILAGAFVFLQAALVFSGASRGNLIAVAILPVAGLFHMGFHGKSRMALAAGGMLLIILASAGAFMVQDGLLSSPERSQMNENVIGEWSFAGKGMNTYQETFPAVVKRWFIKAPMNNENLENEYLQVLYEGGGVPFLFAAILACYVIIQSVSLLFIKGGRFWLVPPLIAETMRAYFDMSFHVFPLVGVFLLIISMARKTERAR